MKITLLILATALMGFVANAQNTDLLLNQYLKIKDALVQSDSKAAKTEIKKWKEMVEKSDVFKEKQSLLKAIQKMDKATDLEKQRAALNEVSSILWNFIQSQNSLKQDVYYQYCPMKKSYWISNEAIIKNPYYGSKMLNCGNVSDKKLK